jgi:hypothetical protein
MAHDWPLARFARCPTLAFSISVLAISTFLPSLFPFLSWKFLELDSGISHCSSPTLSSSAKLYPTLAVCYFINESELSQAFLSVYSISRIVRSKDFRVSVRIYIFNWSYHLSPWNSASLVAVRAANPRIQVRVLRMEKTNLALECLFVARTVDSDFILYLDSDTVCGRDFVAEVQQHLAVVHVLYAVRDPESETWPVRKLMRWKQINVNFLVNPGVLLMRTDGPLQEMLEQTSYHIQRTVNSTKGIAVSEALYRGFNPEWMGILPKRFNCYGSNLAKLGDAVFHHGKGLAVAKELQVVFRKAVHRALLNMSAVKRANRTVMRGRRPEKTPKAKIARVGR